MSQTKTENLDKQTYSTEAVQTDLPAESNPLETISSDTHSEENSKSKINMTEMMVAFLSPALFGKMMLLYFGSMYSKEPGRGWGIALCCAILFTLTMVGRFIWKYKDYSED